jgi:hypothetical protein
MQRTKYLTNYRLWFLLSFILFIPGWFIPFFTEKNFGAVTAAGVVSQMVKYPLVNVKSCLFMLMLVILFAVPALSIGWVLQSLITIARSKRNITASK